MEREDILRVILDYCKENIHEYDVRADLAFDTMAKWRCPLSHADASLYSAMIDAIEEWADENGYNADDYDVEEVIWLV